MVNFTLILHTTQGGLSLLPLPHLLEAPCSPVCQYITQRAGKGDVPVGCLAPGEATEYLERGLLKPEEAKC